MSSSYAAASDDFDALIDFNGGMDTNYGPEDSQAFSGPSHDYHQFPQQTGFATGSMSNFAAYNDADMGNSNNDFLNQPDFNTGYSANPDLAYNSSMDFGMDFGVQDNIDPTAVYGQPQPPVRMYPGMHTQQAAEQAKAAALAKQQQQLHLMQRYQAQQAQASSSAAAAAASSSSAKGKQRAVSQGMTDPVAERKISDILDNMRHKSNMAALDEDDNDSQSGRGRLNDEDMDDDERLLASEEGKKLSSKERRQLRNKVSARAFRSRRKEYISQLEGDLANKANEASDLRLINRKLLDENNQLKNLTRTVLSHPAFHSFLEDMSRNPTFVPPPAHMTAPKSMPVPTTETAQANAPTSSQEVKQEPEQFQDQHFRAQGDDLQVNMAEVPHNSLDLSVLNLGNSHWSSGQNSGFGSYQPQVFALFDLPQGPSKEEILAATPSPAAVASAVSDRDDGEDLEHSSSPCQLASSPAQHVHSTLNVSSSPVDTTSCALDAVDSCIAHMNMLFDTLQPPTARLLRGT